jgi:hypothetical protein
MGNLTILVRRRGWRDLRRCLSLKKRCGMPCPALPRARSQNRRLRIERFLWAFIVVGIALYVYEDSPLKKTAYNA